MNKMIIATIATIAAAILAGCNNVEDSKDVDKAWDYHGMGGYTKAVEIEGHQYILMRGYRSSGIVHAASCECLKK